MSRDKILDTATKLIAWINTKSVDAAGLEAICVKDVVVPIPYPGATADFAGLVATTEKIHGACPDFVMEIRDHIVDETDSKIVIKLQTIGTQEGEWLGVPPSGKKFDTLGFQYLKIDRASGKINEVSMIFQDLLFLQQVGVIPMNPQA